MRELGDTTTFILRFFFSCSGCPGTQAASPGGPPGGCHTTPGDTWKDISHKPARFLFIPFVGSCRAVVMTAYIYHAAMYSVIITASRSWPGTASASLSGISKNILSVFVGDTDTYPCILPLSWNFRRMSAYRLENYWQSPIPAGIFNMVFFN